MKGRKSFYSQSLKIRQAGEHLVVNFPQPVLRQDSAKRGVVISTGQGCPGYKVSKLLEEKKKETTPHALEVFTHRWESRILRIVASLNRWKNHGELLLFNVECAKFSTNHFAERIRNIEYFETVRKLKKHIELSMNIIFNDNGAPIKIMSNFVETFHTIDIKFSY